MSLVAFALVASVVALRPAVAEEAASDAADTEAASAETPDALDTAGLVIGSAEEWEEDATAGRRMLKGKVRITRQDGSGHLWADEVEMLYDPEGDSRKVETMHALGNVNLREADFTATSDTADFTEGTAVVDLYGSVVVLMGEDRMEADHFRYDRRTGKKNAEGNVQFRFRLPSEDEDAPVEVSTETDEATDTEEPDADGTAPDQAADQANKPDVEQHGGSED